MNTVQGVITGRDPFALECADALEWLPSLPDRCVDMIACDLPYGTTACEWDAIIPFEPLWAEYKRVVKPNAAIVLTASQPFTSMLVMSNPRWFRYCWVWNKVNRITGYLDAKNRPLKITEDVAVFASGQTLYNPLMTVGVKYSKPFRRGKDNTAVYGNHLNLRDADGSYRYPNNIIHIPAKVNEGNYHPTQKPVALFEYLIKTYSNEGDIILDNAFGSGTTGVAAAKTGRRFIGCDNDPRYFSIASRRIGEAYAGGYQLSLEAA